jgi:spermidine/putrescine transport system permease protein
MSPRRRLPEFLCTAPSFVWLTALFVVPTALVFAIAFKPPDLYGGVGPGWTLATLRALDNPSYPAVAWRTLWLSAATAALCILLAIPTGYSMARAHPRWRPTLVLLTVVPFWISFLIRVFAWKQLLHPEGPLKHALAAAGLISPKASLLYTPGAVLLVLVYSYLPFAILPVYAAAEKFDFLLFEAAMDLGASRFRAFVSVFLPAIRRGILTAVLVVFIPALGSYVIPDVVGGPTSAMIGNKIAQRTFVDRNLPHASALSALLTLAVLLPLVAAVIRRERPVRPLPEAAP